MSWDERLSDPALNLYYFLMIEGIPQIPTSMTLPAAWFTGGYTQLAGMLDVSGGISIPAQALNRKAGASTPAQMVFRIGPDDLAGTLRKLFATRKSTALGAKGAILAATLDWTEGEGGAGTITVNSNSGWVNGDDCYIGRETIGITGTTDADKLNISSTRAKYGSVTQKYLVDDDSFKGSRLIANHPMQWEGRHVRLYAGLCSPTGQVLDNVWSMPSGDSQWEIWRGVIKSLKPADSWKSWDIQCSSIDCVIDTEVGSYQPVGKIGWTQGNWASAGTEVFFPTAGWVLEGENTITVVLKPPGSDEYSDEITATITAGFYSDVFDTAAQALITEIKAFYSGVYPAGADPDFTSWTEGDKYKEGNNGDLSPFWQDRRAVLQLASGQDWAGYLKSSETSMMRMLGFPAGRYDLIKLKTSSATATLLAIEANLIPALYIGPGATQILVREEAGQYGMPFSDIGGFAVISNDDKNEIIQYTGVTVSWAHEPRVISLTGCTRGLCGTKAQEWSVPVSDLVPHSSVKAAGDPPKIQGCLAFSDTDLLTIFLELCMSTGDNANRHATYDVAAVPEFVGAGLPSLHFDIDKFEAVTAELGDVLSKRNIAFFEPFNLKGWIGPELAALGYTILSRRTPNGYQITLDKVRDPLVMGGQTITHSDIQPTDWPEIRSELGDIINRLDCDLVWMVGKGKFSDSKIIINEIDSQIDNGVVQTLEVQMKGAASDTATGQHIAELIGPSILSHFARRYEIITLSVRRRAWAFQPGDQINVTLAGIPNWDGTSGWTAEPTVLLAMEPTYAGGGREAATKLTLLHLPDRKLSYYCPTGEIASILGAVITLKANEYSDSGIPNPITGHEAAGDIQWFCSGMKVLIREPGEEDTNEESATILSVDLAARTITLTGAPAGGWIGAGDVVTFDGWDAVATVLNLNLPDGTTREVSQKSWVFIGDNDASLGAANDDAYQYSG